MTRATAEGLLAGLDQLVSSARGEAGPWATAIDEERSSVEAVFRAVRPMLQAKLQQRLDQADEESPKLKCEGCGQLAQWQGRRERGWQSTVGRLQLKRRYRWCERCQQGPAPGQKQVGLPAGDLTAGLEEVTTMMATTVPHEMAVDLVQELLGVNLSGQAVKSSVARGAEQVIKQQDEEAKEINEFEAKWDRSPPYITEQAPDRRVEVA